MLALLDGEYKQMRQLRVLRHTLEARNIAIAHSGVSQKPLQDTQVSETEEKKCKIEN